MAAIIISANNEPSVGRKIISLALHKGFRSAGLNRRPVLLVASNGGHWVQLRRLAPAFEGLPIRYVSTNRELAAEVSPMPLSVVPDANLDEKLRLIALAWEMFWVVVTRRPRLIVSTGAAPGFFAIAFGKLVGARTVWVDSIANGEKMSVSGQKVRLFADVWLTQWPHLEKPNGPLYKGAVF